MLFIKVDLRQAGPDTVCWGRSVYRTPVERNQSLLYKSTSHSVCLSLHKIPEDGVVQLRGGGGGGAEAGGGGGVGGPPEDGGGRGGGGGAEETSFERVELS